MCNLLTDTMQRFRAALIFIGLLSAMVGCGYQLQKPLAIDSALQPVYISETTALGIAIKRELLRAGIQTTDKKAVAGSSINLVDAEQRSRSLSLASDGRNAEYLASAAATLVWQDAQQQQLASTPLRAEAIRLARPDTPLAQYAESSQIMQELVAELARQAIASVNRSLSTDPQATVTD